MAWLAASAMPAFGQTFERGVELGGHVAVIRLSEIDATDWGAGINGAWRAMPVVSLDGVLTWFPGRDAAAVGRRVAAQERTLGLFGARSGRRLGRLEIFGRARAGFLRFGEVADAVCIAITTVPLPLECQLATGYTAFATDLGGGVSVGAGGPWQVRVDIADLLVRYGQQAHRAAGQLTNGFTSHNLQVSSGLTWRF